MSSTSGVGGPAPVQPQPSAPPRVSPAIVEWPGAGDPTGGKIRTPESRCNKTDANGNVTGSIIARTDASGTHVVVKNKDGTERPANQDEIRELDRHMQATGATEVGASNFGELQAWQQQRAAVSIQAGTYGAAGALGSLPPSTTPDPLAESDTLPAAAPQQAPTAVRTVQFSESQPASAEARHAVGDAIRNAGQ